MFFSIFVRGIFKVLILPYRREYRDSRKVFFSLFSCCDFSAVGCFLGSSPPLVAVVCQLLCRSASWSSADTRSSVLHRLPLGQVRTDRCLSFQRQSDIPHCLCAGVKVRPLQLCTAIPPCGVNSRPLESAGAPAVGWSSVTLMLHPSRKVLLFDTFQFPQIYSQGSKIWTYWNLIVFLFHGTQETPLCHFESTQCHFAVKGMYGSCDCPTCCM